MLQSMSRGFAACLGKLVVGVASPALPGHWNNAMDLDEILGALDGIADHDADGYASSLKGSPTP